MEYVRCARLKQGFIHGRLMTSGAITSTVDHEGRWKAAHYILRKAMASLWTAGQYSAKAQQAELFAFNDSPKPFKGELVWRLVRTQGEAVLDGATKVALEPASQAAICTVALGEALEKHGAADLFLWLNLNDEQGETVSSNVVAFCEPREWSLPHPRMRADIRIWDDNSYAVTLTSPFTVMWVWLSLEGMDARYDDNYFCLEPGRPTRIRVTPSRRLKPEQFRQLIRIGSVRDGGARSCVWSCPRRSRRTKSKHQRRGADTIVQAPPYAERICFHAESRASVRGHAVRRYGDRHRQYHRLHC